MIIAAQRIPDNEKIHQQKKKEILIYLIFHFLFGKLNILKLNYTKHFINLINTKFKTKVQFWVKKINPAMLTD